LTTDKALSTSPAQTKSDFIRDLGSIEKSVQHGISSSRAKAAKVAWVCWEHFCVKLAVDPLLQTILEESKY
jgi:hypothetical protein